MSPASRATRASPARSTALASRTRLAAEAATRAQHCLWVWQTAWQASVRAGARVCPFMHGSKLPVPAECAAAGVGGARMRRVLLLSSSGLQGWVRPQGSTECCRRKFECDVGRTKPACPPLVAFVCIENCSTLDQTHVRGFSPLDASAGLPGGGCQAHHVWQFSTHIHVHYTVVLLLCC